MADLKGVFISHRKADTLNALAVSLRLTLRNVPHYLDEVDSTLEQDPDLLTQHLTDALYRCTHLLAIISGNTQGSWWVPFEIGMATARGYPIATYLLEDVVTPEYLRPWPYLRSSDDLELYVQELRRHPGMLTEAYMLNKSASDRSYDAGRFHQALKRALGQ
jgi:hypothetical protein